jgi:hypothetical protein
VLTYWYCFSLSKRKRSSNPDAVKVRPLFRGITSAMSRTTSMMRLSSLRMQALLVEGAEDHGVADAHLAHGRVSLRPTSSSMKVLLPMPFGPTMPMRSPRLSE